MLLNRLRKDVEGATMVEFAVVLFALVLLVGGLIDFMHIFWQRNMLIKAVERGARIAAVSESRCGRLGDSKYVSARLHCWHSLAARGRYVRPFLLYGHHRSRRRDRRQLRRGSEQDRVRPRGRRLRLSGP